MLLSEIKNELNLEKLEYEVKSSKPYILEINFDKVLENLSEEYDDVSIDEKYINRNAKFTAYSMMPFVVRDVAFWLDENENKLGQGISEIIKENAGDLCINVTKFDEFKKEVDGVNKISLGYRLIYQSFEKTLTDEEVNKQSDNVYNKLKELGLQVR
jgi:phenylalanyl-tRNA synthetase beta subunit